VQNLVGCCTGAAAWEPAFLFLANCFSASEAMNFFFKKKVILGSFRFWGILN
jgi:hypothetical protein